MDAVSSVFELLVAGVASIVFIVALVAAAVAAGRVHARLTRPARPVALPAKRERRPAA